MLGDRIVELRKKSGMTQEKLAELCDVSRQAVGKWETGISEPSIDKLMELSNIFQVSLDDLVLGKESKGQTQDIRDIICYNSLSFGLGMVVSLPQFALHLNGSTKWMFLSILFNVIQTGYVDPADNVMQEYLVKNTSDKKRKDITEKVIGCVEELRIFFEDYIEGKCELDVVFAKISEYLYEQLKLSGEANDLQRKSILRKHFTRMRALCSESLEVLNDVYIEKMLKCVDEYIEKLSTHLIVDNLFISFAHMIKSAIEERDAIGLKAVADLLIYMEDYILSLDASDSNLASISLEKSV